MLSDVSHETKDKIKLYKKLLLKWNQKINLISKRTEGEFDDRHVLDSLQLSDLLSKEEKIIDIGTGAGLPGCVLAIVGYNVVLVDSDTRKISFLREVVRRLGLKVEIIEDRAENVVDKCTTIVCRGFASIDRIFKLTSNIECDRFLLLKGKNVEDELVEANKKWIFSCKKYKSITSEEACILEITNVRKKA